MVFAELQSAMPVVCVGCLHGERAVSPRVSSGLVLWGWGVMSDPMDLDGAGVRVGSRLAEWAGQAERVSALVDGVEYFRAVRSACIAAQQQIFIVGWEIHSEVDLLRGTEGISAAKEGSWPVRLADLLEALVESRPRLQVRLLIWEGASLFALERQHLPRMKRLWEKHDRITLVWDRDTPKLGSQHQKLVVVDDRVAFVGGMDLTKSRWDSHEHAVDDRRRSNPGLLTGRGHPYHDVMMCVDGEAARVLGGWCRERWHRATGERVDGPGYFGDADDAWPRGVDVLLRNCRVEFALTQPEFGGYEEKRQVEASFIEQIRGAKRLIFIETQYLASGTVADALCERLEDADGPEIVMILPWGCPGKLQAMVMDPRRDELLDALRRADPGGRLGVYWATLRGGDCEDVYEESVYIHAKTMVVDDRLLRIGSANLNARSMGLDTELDAFVSVGDEEQESVRAIASYRRRLLSYLLDVDAERIERAETERGSVVAAIESLRSGDRTLMAFDHRAPASVRAVGLDIELADPDSPLDDMDVERAMKVISERITPPERVSKGFAVIVGYVRRWKWVLVVLGVAVLVVGVWRFTALGELVDRERLGVMLESVRSGPAGLVGVIGGFVLLASFGFPVTVLIGVVGVMLEARWAMVVSVVGVVGSAFAGFALGRLAPRSERSDFRNGRIRSLASMLRGRGVLTVAVVRNVPVAPYAVVNAAFGLSGVSWRDYLVGTLIGMLPGIVLLTVFGSQLAELISEPTPGGVLTALVIGVGIVLGALFAQRVLRRFAPRQSRGAGDESEAGEAREV